MTASHDVIIAYERAGDLAAELAEQVPGLTIAAAETPADLDGVSAPVVFATQCNAFPEGTFARMMARPELRWVQVGGSGYEHLGRWDPDRISVTNCAGVLAPFLAETCMGAMLAMNHRLLDYRDHQRAGKWRRHRFRPLQGQTLAIVGMGAIGSRFGALARAAGMRVIGLRRQAGASPDADEVRPLTDLPRTLAEADVVSVHLRLTQDTARLFGAATFAAMKPGALFMNTGRGGLVDEAALLNALDGPLGGAYLDVMDTEPLPGDHPFWHHPKVFLTPHAADSVIDWGSRFTTIFADNLRRWTDGAPLENVVTP